MLIMKNKAFHLVTRKIGTATAAATTTNVSTIDKPVVTHFEKLAKEWWDERGIMRALHSMNKLRVPFIRDSLINTEVVPKTKINSPQPLEGINILDVGCGGGFLSEPLARLGANVTGLDATSNLIEIAKAHAVQDTRLKKLTYVCSSIEDYAQKYESTYDAVVASETVEHVSHKKGFLEACVKCLKPGASIFITTMNKTMPSYVLGIFVAENVLQIVPKGTHNWNDFISPPQVQRILEDNKCRTRVIHGMGYNIINNSWFWTSNTSINYALHAVKL